MIDIGKVDWSLVQLVKSGRSVKLMYNKEPLQFCTATLYTPFGVRSIDRDWSNFSEYSIDCSVSSLRSETSETFVNFLKELENNASKLVNDNLDIFKTPKSKQQIPETVQFSPIMRENGTYPKLIKLQLPRDKNGNFESFAFDQNKDKIRLSEDNIQTVLAKGKSFKCILECAKLWLWNDKVGIVWNIVQLKQVENAKRENAIQDADKYTENMILDD